MQNVFYKEAHSLLPGVKCSGNQFTIPGLECSGNQRAGHRKLSTLQDISARFQDPHSQITSVPDPSPVRHPAVFQSARTLQDFPASLLEFTCLLHLAATCSSGTSYRFCSAAVVPGSADPLPLQQQSSQSAGSAATLPGFLAVLPVARPLTVDRGVQLPRPVRCDLDGRARSATGGEGTCSRYHSSLNCQPNKIHQNKN